MTATTYRPPDPQYAAAERHRRELNNILRSIEDLALGRNHRLTEAMARHRDELTVGDYDGDSCQALVEALMLPMYDRRERLAYDTDPYVSTDINRMALDEFDNTIMICEAALYCSITALLTDAHQATFSDLIDFFRPEVYEQDYLPSDEPDEPQLRYDPQVLNFLDKIQLCEDCHPEQDFDGETVREETYRRFRAVLDDLYVTIGSSTSELITPPHAPKRPMPILQMLDSVVADLVDDYLCRLDDGSSTRILASEHFDFASLIIDLERARRNAWGRL